MNLLKICSLILFYFLSRVVFAADCETMTSASHNQTVCWNDTIKGWVSESCSKSSCKSLSFFEAAKPLVKSPQPELGRNPASLVCNELKLSVTILRDKNNNEQTFCLFTDKSLADANAIARYVR